MSGVPYVFGNATTSIPLSQLDVNFATNATLGNATVGLGNTTTTVGNLTVQNVTLSSTNGDANIHGLTVGQGGGSVSTNTAVGYQALYSNTASASTTAVGYQAGYGLTGSSNNTLFGYQAGYNIGGYTNTLVGYSAGSAITSGNQNTILGTYVGNQNGLDIRTASNYIVLSEGSGAWKAYSNATNWYQNNNSTLWSITSDERIKKNIAPLENGLSVILALQPKEFDYIVTNQHDIGFIAQQYENVLPLQITEQDASGEYAELTNGDKVKGIQQNLVPYLVKAIQELSAQVTALQAKVGV